VDVFGTLLERGKGFDHEIPRTLSKRIGLLSGVAEGDHETQARIRNRLSGIESGLMREAVVSGGDPEISRRAIYDMYFRSEGLSTMLVDDAIHCELKVYRELTTVNTEVRDFVALCKERGKRVVIVSDSQFGREELAELLSMHGLQPFDAIYASSDTARSKFRGGLFEQVIAAERLPADRILHVGDNLLSDVWSARTAGVQALHFRARRPETNSPEYRLGLETLGPVFAAFAHLLLLQSRRAQITRLAFVARDGDFLKTVTERLMAAAPVLPSPTLQYLSLSRRATALIGFSRLDDSAIDEVKGIRADGSFEDRFFEYFDLNAPRLSPPDDNNLHSLRAMLADGEFQRHVARRRDEKKALLADYLRSEGVYSAKDAAFVDIGWKGSTQSFLGRAFSDDPQFANPPFFYLALSSELGPIVPGGPAVGILADQRGSRCIWESGIWHIASLIEAICRASHGTVTGYSRGKNGTVRAIIANDTPSRGVEVCGEGARDRIRSGILEYIDAYGRALTTSGLDEARVRRRAQRRLIRLAFFPRLWEIDAIRPFVQTEGHAQHWSSSLISDDLVHPLRSPRRWLAGLSSPWRSGYVRASGGYLLASAFFCLESALAAAPPTLRYRMREWALRRTARG
jgi:HAD superfamily hydrolase (TIGR01549 family)